MDDPSAIQVGAGAFGVLSAAAIISILIDRIRDYAPGLHGRKAMLAVDGVSLCVAALVLYQIGSDWWDGTTYVGLGLGTLSLGIIARGIWAQRQGPTVTVVEQVSDPPHTETTTTVIESAPTPLTERLPDPHESRR